MNENGWHVVILSAGPTTNSPTGWGILLMDYDSTKEVFIPSDEATCHALNQQGVPT